MLRPTTTKDSRYSLATLMAWQRGTTPPQTTYRTERGHRSMFERRRLFGFFFSTVSQPLSPTRTATTITSKICQLLQDQIALALTTSAISSPSRISASCNLKKARAVAKYISEPSRKDTCETRQTTRLVKRLHWSMTKGCESADTDVVAGCRVSEYARYGVFQASFRPSVQSTISRRHFKTFVFNLV